MPTQKEVIHLTFGTLPHHITTHFFNQQSSHFDYTLGGQETDDDQTSSRVLDPNVDFQEGVGAQSSQSTFFPRQVVVDFRQNIGTKWEAYDVVFEEGGQDYETAEGILQPDRAAEEGWNAWNGPAQVQRTGEQSKVNSTRIANARFEEEQDDQESSDEEDQENDGRGSATVQQHQSASEIRHKRTRLISRDVTPAEYAHNPAHPRSIRPLPALYGSGALVPMGTADPAQTDACPFSTFEMGIGMARYMERQESLFDEQIRWLAEDSDQMQSFALYASTFDGFSGMAHETLELLKDEYPKVNIMAWGADLDDQRFKTQEEDERSQLIRMTNRVLSLWSLSSASIYTPLEVPESLLQAARKKGAESSWYSHRADWKNMYNVGALYAAHIDTVTMPCRLFDERSRRTLPNLASALNWRLNTPVATLGGCLPTPLLAPIVVEAKVPFDPITALLAARGYDADRTRSSQQARPLSSEERAKQAAQSIQKSFVNLTAAPSRKEPMDRPFGQAVVARDDDREALVPTHDALEQWTSLDEPTACIDVIPLSFSVRAAAFPQVFRNLTSNGRPLPHSSDGRKTRRVDRMPTLASLTTTPHTTSLLAEARRWIDQTMIKGHQPLTSFGIGGSRGRSAAGQAANDETEGYLGGREGLMEVRERLEELLGAYEEGLGASQAHLQYEDEQDRVGTDEETPNQGDDSDWDLE